MKLLTRLLTNNLQNIPLLRIDFNMELFKAKGKEGSCMCILHPVLKDDAYIIRIMKDLCDYIRDNYNMNNVI